MPPITVADGVVTPDPFRDVIRTEPAPDLPSLIVDMMPYLLERHTTTSTTTKPTTTAKITSTTSTTTTSTTTTPSTTTTLSTTTSTTSVRSTTTEEQVSPLTPATVNNDTQESLQEKIINDGKSVDELDKDDEDISGLSFDSVLQYLFSGGETTKAPSKSTTVTHNPEQSTVVTHNTIEVTSENAVTDNVTSEGNDTSLLNSIGPTTSIKEPPPGRPPNLEMLPTTTDAAGLGVLKLAGCNIYGRMYRVGRIISELSGPCLECMCTEVGVQCRPLDC